VARDERVTATLPMNGHAHNGHVTIHQNQNLLYCLKDHVKISKNRLIFDDIRMF
jgi:hypothetical protein